MKKYLLSLVLFIYLLIAGVYTYSYFTGKIRSDGVMSSGRILLGGIDGDSNSMPERLNAVSFSGLRPGMPQVTKISKIKNGGAFPVRLYRISVSSGNNMLGNFINTVIKIGNNEVYSGKLGFLTSEEYMNIDPVAINPGQVMDISFGAALDHAAGNTCQGKSISYSFDVYAMQYNQELNGEKKDKIYIISKSDGNCEFGNHFTLEGTNKSGTENGYYAIFYFNWDNPTQDYQYYKISIRHGSAEPAITIELEGHKCSEKTYSYDKKEAIPEGSIDLSKIKVKYDIDNKGMTIKIANDAFPSSWKGFEISATGKSVDGDKQDRTKYVYWKLIRNNM
ncbi:MAG: hypothetical protein QME45_02430 [Clostridiales bacterium]|nr:hypothetical protein [Clostridiales bacterium]